MHGLLCVQDIAQILRQQPHDVTDACKNPRLGAMSATLGYGMEFHAKLGLEQGPRPRGDGRQGERGCWIGKASGKARLDYHPSGHTGCGVKRRLLLHALLRSQTGGQRPTAEWCG